MVPLTMMALALLAPGSCARLRKKSKSDGGAAASVSAATSSAPAPIDAGPSPDAIAAAAAAAEAARKASLDRAKEAVADIRWMIAKGVSVNSAKAGEGDVTTKCDEIASQRSGLGSPPDPEIVKVLDDGSALCAFDVPLLNANESLDHLRGTPSQASRLLMCTVAEREIAKARAVKPNDAKVHRADGRRATLCNR